MKVLAIVKIGTYSIDSRSLSVLAQLLTQSYGSLSVIADIQHLCYPQYQIRVYGIDLGRSTMQEDHSDTLPSSQCQFIHRANVLTLRKTKIET